MPNRCFLLQVCYLTNAACFRSDDRFLLLCASPRSVVSCYSHIAFFLHRLILSGHVELNPGPPKENRFKITINPRDHWTGSWTRAKIASDLSVSAPFPDVSGSLADTLSRVLAGQKQLAGDIAIIKQTFNARFESLEARVSALESKQAYSCVNSFSEPERSEISYLSQTMSKLVSKNDELDNRSRRNNFIVHGLPEESKETNVSLLATIEKFMSEHLEMEFPCTERCHRIGTARNGHPPPVN